jgi:hypothetical protein
MAYFLNSNGIGDTASFVSPKLHDIIINNKSFSPNDIVKIDIMFLDKRGSYFVDKEYLNNFGIADNRYIIIKEEDEHLHDLVFNLAPIQSSVLKEFIQKNL